MPLLIDTSLWIDFVRPRTARKIKQFIAPYFADPDACLAEPIAFEILRHATPAEARQINQQFQTMPMLGTPESVWEDATALGQVCRHKNIPVNSLDLVIGAIALSHNAEIVTFDKDFQQMAGVSKLRVRLLKRPQ